MRNNFVTSMLRMLSRLLARLLLGMFAGTTCTAVGVDVVRDSVLRCVGFAVIVRRGSLKRVADCTEDGTERSASDEPRDD